MSHKGGKGVLPMLFFLALVSAEVSAAAGEAEGVDDVALLVVVVTG